MLQVCTGVTHFALVLQKSCTPFSANQNWVIFSCILLTDLARAKSEACVRQVYIKNSCQKIWWRVNQPFIQFIHHIWGAAVLWGAVFIIQISDKMQYFTILQCKTNIALIQSYLSPRDNQVILISRYTVFTAVKWSQHWWNIDLQYVCDISLLLGSQTR